MKLSLFSVTYAGLWGQQRLDLPAFFAKASSLGCEAVMLMGERPHLAPLDAPADQFYQAARRMVPHIAVTTNADYVRLPRYRYRPELVNYERALPDMVRAVKFGGGFIDYPAFFQGLREGGFEGIANYEVCCPIRGGSEQNLDAYAAHCVQWMRQHVLPGCAQ